MEQSKVSSSKQWELFFKKLSKIKKGTLLKKGKTMNLVSDGKGSAYILITKGIDKDMKEYPNNIQIFTLLGGTI